MRIVARKKNAAKELQEKMKNDNHHNQPPITRGEEALAFVLLAGAVIPAAFVGFCAGVGFCVWALEILT